MPKLETRGMERQVWRTEKNSLVLLHVHLDKVFTVLLFVKWTNADKSATAKVLCILHTMCLLAGFNVNVKSFDFFLFSISKYVFKQDKKFPDNVTHRRVLNQL